MLTDTWLLNVQTSEMKKGADWNMWNGAGGGVQLQNLVSGVFRPFDQTDADDSEGEEEDDFQMLSFKEIRSTSAGGKTFLKRTKQKGIKGTLVDQSRKCQTDVHAGFHLTDPWWRIQILRTDLKKNRIWYSADSCALSYQLLEREWVMKNNVVYQYLNKLMSLPKRNPDEEQENNRKPRNPVRDYTPAPEVEKFYDFVCHNLGKQDMMTFEDLKEMLDEFENYLPEEEKEMAQVIQAEIESNEEAQLVYKALECPLMFSLLPQLLPMQFLDMIHMEERDVKALERDLEERPWVFGFKQVLSKDHQIVGCEAQWYHYEKSGLDQQIKQPYKDGLLIYDFLKAQTKKGHTGIRSSHVRGKTQTLVSDYSEAISFLKRNKVVKEVTIEGVIWIFLYHLYKAEEFIASGVTRLFREQMENQWILDVDFDSDRFDGIRSDPDQLRAAKLLTQLPVVVISGKGGCGKTTVVTKVMSSCESRPESPNVEEGMEDEKQADIDWPPESQVERTFPRILYTAPTGKAANILGKRAGTIGYTLHQVTFSYMRHCQNLKKNPTDKWKFKNINTLVVDECSLVAITTFHSLFKMLIKESHLRRIVLLGDVRQLPSIEPGNFLSDMFSGLQNLGCAVELRTNHRSESELIIENATRISKQRCPVFDPKRNFKLHLVEGGSSKEFLNQAVLNLLRREKSLMNDKTSQFVAFTNKDITIVNEVCLQFYNKHPQVDCHNKPMFLTGDKICMTRNSLITLYEESDNGMKPVTAKKEEEEEIGGNLEDLSNFGADQEKEANADSTQKTEIEEKKEKNIRLCNGEVFFIKDDKTIIDCKSTKSERYLYLSNEDPDDPKEFWCSFRELKKFCKIRHAWARTIHTFQGSETGAVVYYLGSSVSWQNWQHVYTAVTRGKKEVHILGTHLVLSKAIAAKPNVRWTSLKYQLNKILPDREQLNQSLQASIEDTDDHVLPFTQTNSFSMDKPEDETFTRIVLSPRKPDLQSPRAGPHGQQPSTSFVATSGLYRPRPLNFSPNFLPNSKQHFQRSKLSGLDATSTPLVRQTLNKFSNLSPVPKLDELASGNKSSNDSQWSEVDESMLLISEEQARNESLLENCGPLRGGRDDGYRNGEAPKVDDEGCEFDATQSPDEDVEDNGMIKKEKVQSSLKQNRYSGVVQQDRLPEISPRKKNNRNEGQQRNTAKVTDDADGDFDEDDDDIGELSRLCEVAERTVNFQRSNGQNSPINDSGSEPSSPSLLSPVSSKSIQKFSNGSGIGNGSNFDSHRSVTGDNDLFDSDDGDDGRNSPSILSSSLSPSPLKRNNEECSRGEVTPKKLKLECLQSLASPMRRKLDNLSMSQD